MRLSPRLSSAAPKPSRLSKQFSNPSSKPSGAASASSSAASASLASSHARPASAATPAPAKRSTSPPAKPSASSPAKNSKASKPKKSRSPSLRPSQISLGPYRPLTLWRKLLRLCCTYICESHCLSKLPVTTPPSDSSLGTFSASADCSDLPPRAQFYIPVLPRPSFKSLILAIALFLLTLCTCLAAGTQFATAYAHNEAVSLDEFLRAFTLFYKNPAALLAGLPFAATLLTILLAHELGHFFACRHHHIHSSYPFFIPFPSLIGTFGAFILMRSPIRTTRALFDVGASGPLFGFIAAFPALVFGIFHAKIVPGLADPNHVSAILGAPLILRGLAAIFYPHAPVANILLNPVGRAAWVGLFATSLN